MASAWRALSAPVLVALALALGGCVTLPEQIAVGTPRAELLQTLGQPTARYQPDPKSGVHERLQYSMQPSGQTVYNFDLDAGGRLIRAQQALNETLFGERILPDRWTREDVLYEYGRPARIQGVHNFKGDIWVWRYVDGITWRLLFIDVDPQGVVRGFSMGDDPQPEDRAP
ncbi:hypothetical protein [Ottowia thiooxydans]|uniref:hypothetical protein n=1 Tax=Ottowia thiooxydans TaxID=219182 RepID=UPI0003FB2022|nr:hypothetical protein [Ottowia thiooxydans]